MYQLGFAEVPKETSRYFDFVQSISEGQQASLNTTGYPFAQNLS